MHLPLFLQGVGFCPKPHNFFEKGLNENFCFLGFFDGLTAGAYAFAAFWLLGAKSGFFKPFDAHLPNFTIC